MVKKFKNMKISSKLNVSFIIVTLLAVFSTAVADTAIWAARAIMPNAATIIIVASSAMVACIASAIVLAICLKNVIAKPLTYMTVAIDKLAEGDLAYFNNDTEFGDTNDEGVILAKSLTGLVVNTREKVSDLEQIANGDLTVRIHDKGESDVMGKALIAMINNLHKMIKNIWLTSQEMDENSTTMQNSSLALAQGATEQASAIQQLTASLEEIASQTSLNAQTATSANMLAKKAEKNALDGNARMQDMLKAISEISDSSHSINKIIKVIDDIAFQTNILALNAAVEAARAGQYGRGFAVVAEEVRSLATKSANAAKETTTLIEGSILKVEAGTKIAKETAETLSQIVEDCGKTAELINGIDNASSEQSLGISQINIGIAQVAQVVQTTATTAEENATSSEKLTGQAGKLNENISSFRLKRNSKQSASTATQVKSIPRTTMVSAPARISLGEDFGKY